MQGKFKIFQTVTFHFNFSFLFLKNNLNQNVDTVNDVCNSMSVVRLTASVLVHLGLSMTLSLSTLSSSS